MILLLASYGAMIIDPVCEDSRNIMEYVEENSILAQAQIIVIRA